MGEADERSTLLDRFLEIDERSIRLDRILVERNWGFTWDMTGDGITTISDVGAWVGWLFFYPGDFLLAGVMLLAPLLARFLEIGPSSYGGLFSGLFSGVWYIFMFLAGLGIFLGRDDDE